MRHCNITYYHQPEDGLTKELKCKHWYITLGNNFLYFECCLDFYNWFRVFFTAESGNGTRFFPSGQVFLRGWFEKKNQVFWQNRLHFCGIISWFLSTHIILNMFLREKNVLPTTDIDHHHHHHHIVLAARISLTLSRHSSLSFIALGRSSGQQPVSSHSCWMYVRAGRPAFARPCVGIHKSTSLMSSSLLLQQCPACLVRLTWIVFVIGGRWPYSWCLVGCCCQDLFRIARSILV